jgi:glycosyltransferase involved in cell wall biosynthesis
LSTLFLKTKVFVSDRTKPDIYWGRFNEYIRNKLYPKAAGIIAQTEYAANIYKRRFNANTRVIGNPIRINNGNSVEREKIIISVGRLISTKRFDHLIDIFSRISDSDWKLYIYGEGPKRTFLENQIKVLGLEGKVFLFGHTKDIESQLLKASIFAFTSNSEGFPNAIGEAMSAGLPVISYNFIAGSEDLIIDGVTGFLIPMDRPDSFKEKLFELMNNPKLRAELGSEAKKYIDRFSGDKICLEFYNFITHEH